MDYLVLSVDPGRDKCGLALVSLSNGILIKKVVKTAELEQEINLMIHEHQPNTIIMGSGTWSKKLKSVVGSFHLPFEIVDERHSTEQARLRFFKDHPPKGLMRLVPLGLQSPQVPYDDYAAVVLAERFFETRKER